MSLSDVLHDLDHARREEEDAANRLAFLQAQQRVPIRDRERTDGRRGLAESLQANAVRRDAATKERERLVSAVREVIGELLGATR